MVSPSPSQAIDPKKTDSNSEQQAEPSKKNSFSENEIAEMEMVFESSPKDAQNIVKHLEDPNYYNGYKDYRSAYFIGEPGCGKTTMAKAIAYKMAKKGWEHKIISSTQLLRVNRNSTSVQLERELQEAVASNKQVVIVIDELNRLLEHSDSKHHDTDATATTLWTFLDRESENENIFLIGTMNRIDKLPKPFKSRMHADYIKFFYISDPDMQQKTLRKYFAKTTLKLDAEVTDDFLRTEFAKMGPCSGRILKRMFWMTSKIQRREEDGPITSIKKSDIKDAINELIERNEEMGYNQTEETDEERQERYHNINSSLQTANLLIQTIQVAPKIAENIARVLVTIFF